jgi:peptide deformylase
MSFKLLQLGHPHLRLQAKPIADVSDPVIQTMIDDLLVFVEDVGGMGIAAPQVDLPLQLFIMASKPNARYPSAPVMPQTVVINPEILSLSDSQEAGWEGCLSVPGLRGLVSRSDHISVRYITRAGDVVETEYDGFIARIFQHEYDHLQGKLFTDRVASNLDLMAEQQWQHMLNRQNGQADG